MDSGAPPRKRVLPGSMAAPQHPAKPAGKKAKRTSTFATAASSGNPQPTAGHHASTGAHSAEGQAAGPSPQAGCLNGAVIWLHGSIPHLSVRSKALISRTQALGGTASAGLNMPANCTHVVVGPGHVIPDTELQAMLLPRTSPQPAQTPVQPSSCVVQAPVLTQNVCKPASEAEGSARFAGKGVAGDLGSRQLPKVTEMGWLEAAITTHQRQVSDAFRPENQAALEPPTPSPKAALVTASVTGRQFFGVPLGDPTIRPSRGAKLAKYFRWLGFWHPVLDHVTRESELMCWPRYNIERSEQLGNEPVAKLLIELSKYEAALGQVSTEPQDRVVHRRELTYTHAAAAVRGCAFSIPDAVWGQPNMRTVSGSGSPSREPRGMTVDDLRKALPYVGSKHIAGIVYELIVEGSHERLRRFRNNEPVTDSLGMLRPDSAGASSRRMFQELPGVGSGHAARFWEAGCRTYDDLERWAQQTLEQQEEAHPAKQQQTAAQGIGGPALLQGTTAQSKVAAISKARQEAMDSAYSSDEDSGESGGNYGTSAMPFTGARQGRKLGAGGSTTTRSSSDAETTEEHSHHSSDDDDHVADSAGQKTATIARPRTHDCGLSPGLAPGLQRVRFNAHVLKDVLFSVRHREDILHGVAQEERSEMQEVVTSTLKTLTGLDGWELVPVGSTRRMRGCQDADFFVTHPSHSMGGLSLALYEQLVTQGHMVRTHDGFCRIRHHKGDDYLQHLTDKTAFGKKQGGKKDSNIREERHDFIFGVWITTGGRYRRIDLIFVPRVTFWYGLVGWTGSRGLLRFGRDAVSTRGMKSNNMTLMRLPTLPTDSPVYVPWEGPPLNRQGVPEWPPGWPRDPATGQPQREVKTEEQLFDLMGLPCWPPEDRNCP